MWAAKVTQSLQEFWPDTSFEYLNAAVPGYTTVESSARLDASVSKYRPDITVIYHATNDLASISRLQAIDAGKWQQSKPGWLASRFVVFQYLSTQLELLKLSGKDHEVTVPFDVASAARTFERRLSTLVVKAKELETSVALATFSHRLRADVPPGELSEAAQIARQNMPYLSIEQLQAGYDAFNEVIRKVARANAVLLIESAEAIPATAEFFTDSFHFNDAGSARMARVVTAALEASPALARLAHSPAASTAHDTAGPGLAPDRGSRLARSAPDITPRSDG